MRVRHGAAWMGAFALVWACRSLVGIEDLGVADGGDASAFGDGSPSSDGPGDATADARADAAPFDAPDACDAGTPPDVAEPPPSLESCLQGCIGASSSAAGALYTGQASACFCAGPCPGECFLYCSCANTPGVPSCDDCATRSVLDGGACHAQIVSPCSDGHCDTLLACLRGCYGD